MSNFQPQKPLTYEDGYVSDGSWCSDFDEDSETSEVWNMSSSEDYSKEIEDNKINEHIEAKLYANMPPLPCTSAKENPESETAATSAPFKKILERKFGAIPKTAFSYLNNELHQNLKSNLLTKDKQQSTENLEDENVKFHSNNTPPQPVKSSINIFNSNKILSYDANDDKKQAKERSEINQKSNIETSPHKSPSKLKPEAFSFLSKVIENQSFYRKETTTKTENREHPLPVFVDKEKKSSENSEKMPKIIEINKYESFVPEATAPFLYDFEDSFTHSANPALLPLQTKNTNKTVKAVQRDEKNNQKPPLPDRPPPVFKYPPSLFSQQASGTPKTDNSEEHNFTLPTFQVQMFPNTGKYSLTTDKATVNIEQKHVSLVQEMQNKHKREIVMSDRPNNVSTQSKEHMDKIKHNRNSCLPNDIYFPSLKNMSERPLPPAPTSNTSKMNENTNMKQYKHDILEAKTIEKDLFSDIAVAKKFSSMHTIRSSTDSLNRNVSDLISEETGQISQDTRLEDQTFKKQFKPDLKPKPKKRLDIISQQTNVSSQTFHSQHEISTALRARLQSVSYEEPKNQSDPPDSIDQEDSKGFSNIVMTSSKQVISSHEESDPLDSKRILPARKISDIDEIQQAIVRPCLPQKLKTTQRSLSCTSLVQTFKDIGFSIWSNNEKEKRRSEGRSSAEFASKNFAKEIKHIEKSKIQILSTASLADKESVSKGLSVYEEKISKKPNQEKSIASFAWYHHLNARDAQRLLLAFGEDGTFLIRPSSNVTADIQYTTCIVYSGRVINLHIRQKPNGQYALGKEKPDEETFSSISDLIKFHQEVPIEIRPTSRSSTSPEFIHVYLRVTPPK